MERISPCWASSFARGGKGTKTPPGRPRAIPLRYPRRPGPHYGRAGGLALISDRKICERSHRLLLRKMEKILRGISNTARLDGSKDRQQLLLTHLARRGRPKVPRIGRAAVQNGRLAILAGAPRDC